MSKQDMAHKAVKTYKQIQVIDIALPLNPKGTEQNKPRG